MVRSHAEWEMLIKEAYASELPLKRWCREHDINYDTFKCAKRKLLENGKLQQISADYVREKRGLSPELVEKDREWPISPLTEADDKK